MWFGVGIVVAERETLGGSCSRKGKLSAEVLALRLISSWGLKKSLMVLCLPSWAGVLVPFAWKCGSKRKRR